MCSDNKNKEPQPGHDRRESDINKNQDLARQIREEFVQPEQSKQSKESVEEQVDDYENRLRAQYRRVQDQDLIARETSSLRRELLKRELQLETRPIHEIQSEEKRLINMTFVISLSVILIFVIAALTNADQIEGFAKNIRSKTIANLSWFYLLASTSFLLFIIYLGFSRFGNVVLGDPNEKPEFSDLSWAAMLFAAGMGSGLLFWGGAEPLLHYTSPPVGESRTPQAGSMAMTYTALHWCLHGWGIYTIGALAVAYFGFRRRKKYLVSSCIPEVFANANLQTILRAFCDISATLAVIFGMGASLGMGTEQFAKGLNLVYEIPLNGVNLQITVLAIVTALFLFTQRFQMEE